VFKFIEFLPITKGKLAGRKIKLLPDQREFIQNVYGRFTKDGRRLTRTAVKSEPKGNGKTGLLAPMALCHLLGPESEQRGEIYSAAIDRQQAGIMFNEMEAIISEMPEFDCRVNIQRFHKRIEVLEGTGKGSIYEALSADARRSHGLAPSLWVYDELAQARDREMFDGLMNAMGKRNEPLAVIISTQAPNDDHVLSQLIDDGLSGADPSIYVQLHAAPVDADPFDEKVWKACNPAWGIFLDEVDFRQKAELAKRQPAFESSFRNLRLNQRIDANDEHRIVTPAVWKLGAVPVDLNVLAGRDCYGGLDLSGKHDLTAFELVFPDSEGGFNIVSHFWTPEGQLGGRSPNEQTLFRTWIAAGHMIAVPGPVIEYRYVAAQIAAIAKRFNILAIGYDRWRIDEFKHELGKVSCEVAMEPFGQGYKDMSPAVENLAELALTARLRHGGHPVLNACVANAILTKPDDAGNMKFAKGKANEGTPVRIDGIVALAMALGTAKRKMIVPGPIEVAYERGGMFL
jgi:phage terminase large subunit-like protein